MPAPLTTRLIAVVEAAPRSQVDISRAAGQRDTWLGSHLAAWRGRGRRGADPRWSTLELLARGLGCTLGELLGPELLGRPTPPARP